MHRYMPQKRAFFFWNEHRNQCLRHMFTVIILRDLFYSINFLHHDFTVFSNFFSNYCNNNSGKLSGIYDEV